MVPLVIVFTTVVECQQDFNWNTLILSWNNQLLRETQLVDKTHKFFIVRCFVDTFIARPKFLVYQEDREWLTGDHDMGM
jgi:hypothetical protein